MKFFKKYFNISVVLVGIILLFFMYSDILNWKKKEMKRETDVCGQPKTNMAFLKTHKTASTSVANTFLRYANKYQRLVVFSKNPLPGDFNKFHGRSALGLKPGYNYSIFAQHTIFDYQEVRAVMPNDTKYITILRDPLAQFESLYNFLFLELYNGMNISTFANLNISDPEQSKIIRTRLFGKFGCNQMAYDLGIDPTLFDNPNDILEKVQELDEQFDLVMITELFDQSLILLKETLCWEDWNDVISFKINARKAENKTRLSAEQKENLRRINRVDQMVYDHFHQKLLRQIDAFGKKRMENEVEKLREATREMFDFCVDEESTLKENENIDEIMSFMPKKEAESYEVCADLTVNYYQLMASIFSKQKLFFWENELFLDLIEILYSYTYDMYLVWRAIHFFLERNIIVNQYY